MRIHRFTMVVTLTFLTSLAGVASASKFEENFTGATARLEFLHIGDGDREYIALQGMRLEGVWAGSRVRTVDRDELGRYRLEVLDLTGDVLYSRGFASVYGEWESHAEPSASTSRAFQQSVRFPEPRKVFQVRISKRDFGPSTHEIWSGTFDPQSRFVDRSPVVPQTVWSLQEKGRPTVKVDLTFLGDGYTVNELPKFHAAVGRLSEAIFRTQPFADYREDFNVRAIDTPTDEGREDGSVTDSTSSPLGTRFDSGAPERLRLTFDDRRWREIAAATPYDFVVILVNDDASGTGGMYQNYAAVHADSKLSDYELVHSLGHAFASLADEGYVPGPLTPDAESEELAEPWQPNLAARIEGEAFKWHDLVEAETPIPTPWRKDAFEAEKLRIEEERRRLEMTSAPTPEAPHELRGREQRVREILESHEHVDEVGAFEGAGGRSTGLYRPEVSCAMFGGGDLTFCAVCARTIERVIRSYTR